MRDILDRASSFPRRDRHRVRTQKERESTKSGERSHTDPLDGERDSEMGQKAKLGI